ALALLWPPPGHLSRSIPGSARKGLGPVPGGLRPVAIRSPPRPVTPPAAGSRGGMEPTDRELVERLQGGDHAAFERLWRRHREWLYRQALVQARGRAAVAEEVVQDVF